jgi:hypothetical protein
MSARIRVAVIAIGVAVMTFGAGCTAATPSPGTGASTPASPAASTTTSPAAETTPSFITTATSAKPDTSSDGKHIAFITSVKKSGADYVFVLDYAELLTGDAAYAQGKKDGVEVDNDYYIRNVNKKLRTLKTNGNVPYITYADVPDKAFTYKVSDFYTWRTDGKKPTDFPELSNDATFHAQAQNTGANGFAFFFTVKNGLITKMEYFWTP